MIVGFWSLCNGHGKVSTSALASALYIANNFDLSSVLINAQEKHVTCLDGMFTGNLSDGSDTGLDKMLDLVSEDTVDNRLKNYTDNLIPERLDYIKGSRKSLEELKNKEINIKHVVENSTEVYDTSLVDIGSGYVELRKELLNCSNTVVICLEQNERYIREHAKYIEQNKNLFANKIILYLINGYNSELKCSLNLCKKILKTKRVFQISYSAMFSDSLTNNTFNKFVKTGGQDFHRDLEVFCCTLLNCCGYNVKPSEDILKSSKVKTKGFLGGLLKC